MMLQLSEQERGYLHELLEGAHKEKLHELHHADTSEYKRILRDKLRIIEDLTAKLALQGTGA